MQRRLRADNHGMGPDPRSAAIAALIESVSLRADRETDRLVAEMLGRSWPAGTGDSSETAALEWVRRWGPRTAGLIPPICTCAHGHCPLCN